MAPQNTPLIVPEAYPDSVKTSLERRNRHLKAASPSLSLFAIVRTINRWKPGSTVRVAFLGGNRELYEKIEAAAKVWTAPGVANIELKFKGDDGNYLQWAETDTLHRAEIRIAFRRGIEGGNWSLVGNDSVDPDVHGGGPGQASLNLDSFDVTLPDDWRSVVLHEFGHALGFEHEHQNPDGGGCDFRFADDPGYLPILNANGWFAVNNGKRPGLYTYLGGKANYWSKAKVDSNLRDLSDARAFGGSLGGLVVSRFDELSIMKYVFNSFMFVKGTDSRCYTEKPNTELSTLDKAGARQAYSSDPFGISELLSQQNKVLKGLIDSPTASGSIRSNAQKRLESVK